MHLFITTPHLKDDSLIISDEKLVHQMTHVLRIKPGEHLCVQETVGALTQRRTVTCDTCSKKEVVTTIVNCQKRVKNESKIRLAIAFPNKRDKAELIVQKLTEIGVDEILFFPAQRSILRDCPEKKLQRMEDIAREAVEQSWWRFLPEIVCKKNLASCMLPGQRLLMADGNEQDTIAILDLPSHADAVLCIWPEWGFAPDEIAFAKQHGILVRLWNSVLRMETAAIAWWRVQVQKNLIQHSG